MSDALSRVELLAGEKLVSNVRVPHATTKSPGLDQLASMLTNGATTMPLASISLDDTIGEGRFQCEFGRDALIMTALAEHAAPQMAPITILRLCELQGLSELADAMADDMEERGRIIHEHRAADDPRAIALTNSAGWTWPYYGSVDATPLFISAICREARRDAAFLSRQTTLSDGARHSVADCLERALRWVLKRLSRSRTGLLDAGAASNGCWQVWEDSIDAYHHTDGRLARGRVAAVEVQAFAYDALFDVAELMSSGVLDGDAELLFAVARKLQAQTLKHFWSEERHHFATGVEYFKGRTRRLDVRKANMGLILNSRLLEDETSAELVETTVGHLFDTEGLYCTNGIRTLAAGERLYRPTSYHNGSIWPWQNLWIAQGLKRHGKPELADQIEGAMKRVARETDCAPELFSGDDGSGQLLVDAITTVDSPDGNGGYFRHRVAQPGQRFQGWTVFGLLGLDS